MTNVTNIALPMDLASIKTSAASDGALNWLVAPGLGKLVVVYKGAMLTTPPGINALVLELGFGFKPSRPAANWAVGRPIYTALRISHAAPFRVVG